jgi:FAD/FMN-containing dehydrogenase
MQLNDVHSALNETQVACVERPMSLSHLCQVIQRARERNLKVSVAGGRHAMGGQQFLTGGQHIDTTALTRVLGVDARRGLIEVEAGITWPALIAATHAMAHPHGGTWAIRQKQTGVDEVTLAGSISAAAHGRGLLMQPISDDIESLTLVDCSGNTVSCSRTENAELFSLVIGGYGLFGVIYSATLRLSPRQKLIRIVDVIELEDAANAIQRRIDEGCLYGDFQYAIDHTEERFMRKGVFACYRPAPANAPEPDTRSDLPEDAWLKLLALAHTDKTRAFKTYAAHYLQSDGNVYWSDTMQLSTYIPSYADFLQKHSAAVGSRESLVIGEHYVPPDQLIAFIAQARTILRRFGTEVIYGTLRLIQPDETCFLAWARQRLVCVIFNLRTPHTPEGIARTGATFQALTDASASLGGSFFLTYHRFATAAQVAQSHPNVRKFFALKKTYDPDEVFQSDWYLHYRDALAHAPP